MPNKPIVAFLGATMVAGASAAAYFLLGQPGNGAGSTAAVPPDAPAAPGNPAHPVTQPPSSGPAPADPVAKVLGGNESLFSAKELALIQALIEDGQDHLFAGWPAPGTDDAKKAKLVGQLSALDASYHGGLLAYIRNAKKLLAESKEGINPFEGYTPSVPAGEKLDFASAEFDALEAEGLAQVASTAFVLVAGGLGERLGYSGIKVALPAESATGECFLSLYCRYILALQARSGSQHALPLAIMTSDDTHARTEALLKAHGNFGMAPDQVTLMKQEKVACLIDNDAHLALEPSDAYAVQTKPHGHGDVHALLHSTGLAKKWAAQGLKWVCFFQDTNALVFRALTATLGVSARHDYDMNSVAVPRKAKEAIGAIALLRHEDGKRSMTINVEYNQLAPLLQATGHPEGDVNDATGWSPYPGNINQLVLKLPTYVAQLALTGGVISEFVNPKYKDATKTAFKSSTRLECMMQDYPKALPPTAKVGFTVINQVWATYSAVKNSPADALAKYNEGNPTHSATSGELDIYSANCHILGELTGAHLPPPEPVTFNGMALKATPRAVLSPPFAPVVADAKAKIAAGSVTLGTGSTLVLDGEGISVEGPLEVAEGSALVVRAAVGAKVTIRGLSVRNAGWQWQALQPGEDAKEEERIRGFRVVRKEAMELVFDKPGTYSVPEAAPEAPATPATAASSEAAHVPAAGASSDDGSAAPSTSVVEAVAAAVAAAPPVGRDEPTSAPAADATETTATAATLAATATTATAPTAAAATPAANSHLNVTAKEFVPMAARRAA